MKEKIERVLIDTALKIAKGGKGCIFVIMRNKINYEPLISQDLPKFSIFNNERRLLALAGLDGAVIVDSKGNVLGYSCNILNIKSYNGFGTRHSAGYTASINNNTAILASEEDRKVRIFNNGKLIMQLDALEKGIETRTEEAINFLESIGVGSLGAIAVMSIAPSLGIAIVPGIIVFGSTHYLIKLLVKKKNA